ncbi:MAG: peptide chain release factor 1 [Candidatus Methylacidiphilales bacterium]
MPAWLPNNSPPEGRLPTMELDLLPHIERLQARLDELDRDIAAPDLYSQQDRAQQIFKEHKRVKTALEQFSLLNKLEQQVAENRALADSAEDPDLATMAAEELPSLQSALEHARLDLLSLILPPDENDGRNTIIEIRAGTGGDEAALFASDLYRMYQRYAERVKWTLEVMDSSPSELGGYKEIIFMARGADAFRALKYESGVHRVQRVPATESQGRIHTSAATVAVLPEAQEVDFEIKPDEIRIEVCRAGGPGGQGVNTTDSAVQIFHLPTGMMVRCQDGRSQIKNREKALNILRSRLLEKKQAEEDAKYAAHRKSQIGSGDRNEKIRTYNFPQNRVTDHRIHFTAHNLEALMDGDLQELFAALQAHDVEERLKELQSA